MSTVSVIIPTHNRAHYISACVSSAAMQSNPPIEIIVVDDGSTDGTKRVLDELECPLVRYIYQPNAGPSAARNRGIHESRGTFIAFLDSDDLWPPEKLSKQNLFFAKNPSVDFVFGHMANFSGNTSTAAIEIKDKAIHEYITNHTDSLDDLFSCLISENVIPTPTVMGKKSAIDRTGGFNERLWVAEDLEYWLRSLQTCKWGFINEVLLLRRRHDSNLINNISIRNICLIDVLESASKLPQAKAPEIRQKLIHKRNEIKYDLGSGFLRSGYFRDATMHLGQIHSPPSLACRALLKLIASRMLQPFSRKAHFRHSDKDV